MWFFLFFSLFSSLHSLEIKVSPTMQSITVGESGTYFLKNREDFPLVIQIFAEESQITEEGHTLYRETEGLFFSPSHFVLPAHSSRKIYVYSQESSSLWQEKAYRVAIRQFPHLSKYKEKKNSRQMISHYTLFYVKPKNVFSDLSLASRWQEGQLLSMEMHNLGNIHLAPQEMRLEIVNVEENVLFTYSLPKKLLLPHEKREVSIDINSKYWMDQGVRLYLCFLNQGRERRYLLSPQREEEELELIG